MFASATDMLRNSVPPALTSTVQGYADYYVAYSTELRTKIVAKGNEWRDEATTRAVGLRDQAVHRVHEMRDNATTRVTELRERAATEATKIQDTTMTYVAPTMKKVLRSRGGRLVPTFVASKFVSSEEEDNKDVHEKQQDGEEADNKAHEAADTPAAAASSAGIISSSSALIADLKSKCTVENARAAALDGIHRAADLTRNVATTVVGTQAWLKAVSVVPAVVFDQATAAQQTAAPTFALLLSKFQNLDAKFTHGAINKFAHDAAVAAGIFAEQQQQEEEVAEEPAAPANTPSMAPVAPPLAEEKQEEEEEPVAEAEEQQQE